MRDGSETGNFMHIIPAGLQFMRTCSKRPSGNRGNLLFIKQ